MICNIIRTDIEETEHVATDQAIPNQPNDNKLVRSAARSPLCIRLAVHVTWWPML